MEITRKGKTFHVKGKRTEFSLAESTLSFPDRPHLIISGPGEYEVGGVTISGVKMHGVLYMKMVVDGVSLLYLPSIPKGEGALEQFSPVDILLLGEYGEIIHDLEPKILIPIQGSLSQNLGKPVEETKKLTVTADKLPEELKVVVLNG